jgi:hypothetical protein
MKIAVEILGLLENTQMSLFDLPEQPKKTPSQPKSEPKVPIWKLPSPERLKIAVDEYQMAKSNKMSDWERFDKAKSELITAIFVYLSDKFTKQLNAGEKIIRVANYEVMSFGDDYSVGKELSKRQTVKRKSTVQDKFHKHLNRGSWESWISDKESGIRQIIYIKMDKGKLKELMVK